MNLKKINDVTDEERLNFLQKKYRDDPTKILNNLIDHLNRVRSYKRVERARVIYELLMKEGMVEVARDLKKRFINSDQDVAGKNPSRFKVALKHDLNKYLNQYKEKNGIPSTLKNLFDIHFTERPEYTRKASSGYVIKINALGIASPDKPGFVYLLDPSSNKEDAYEIEKILKPLGYSILGFSNENEVLVEVI